MLHEKTFLTRIVSSHYEWVAPSLTPLGASSSHQKKKKHIKCSNLVLLLDKHPFRFLLTQSSCALSLLPGPKPCSARGKVKFP
ncbi:unnamed protein product [Prunus brigantina]